MNLNELMAKRNSLQEEHLTEGLYCPGGNPSVWYDFARTSSAKLFIR